MVMVMVMVRVRVRARARARVRARVRVGAQVDPAAAPAVLEDGQHRERGAHSRPPDQQPRVDALACVRALELGAW